MQLADVFPALRCSVSLLRLQPFAQTQQPNAVENDEPQLWLHRSYTLHELKHTQEAYDLLWPAVAQFPKVWTIRYNLACYCTQLGRLDECKDWFKQAMALDQRTVQLAALNDPDLKPLWDSLSGTMWKQLIRIRSF